VVILQFNRLIRNKWIWGVFAVAISAFFAFDFLIADLRGGNEGRDSGEAGILGDRELAMSEFRALQDDARGIGRQRDRNLSNAEVNRLAWEAAAALDIAKTRRLTATDEEVRQAVLREFRDPSSGAFNMAVYERILRENGLTPEMFEAYMKRRITLMKLRGVVLGSSRWVAPSELDGALNDVTDKLTVKIAYFVDKDGSKVTIDDKGIEAYYKENTNSIALPDCVTVKYVRYPADDAKRLAQFKITEDEMRDHYDATSARFETQTTNGVITKKFEEVKGIVEKELQLIASVEAYRTNLLFRVYPPEAASVSTAKVDRLEKIAAEDKLPVKTSPRFSASGAGYVSGFMSRPEAFVRGADPSAFAAAVAELDPESEDLRYGVVAGSNAVYLVERATFEKAHVPPFAEAKSIIRPRALADARAKAFKAAVEKQRALAAAAIAKGQPFDAKTLAAQSVTTSITFSVSALQRDSFADSRHVAGAAMKLGKGQISEFISTPNPSRGLLVYVENRVPGDAAEAQMVRMQLRDELSSIAAGGVPAAWNRWNLERLGFTTTQISSVDTPDESAVSED
jgi:hypothetical protein